MSDIRKRLLIVNDDGIEAPGLKALVKRLLKEDSRFEVRVVAPATEQSAKSGAMTVHGKLEAQKHVFEEPGPSRSRSRLICLLSDCELPFPSLPLPRLPSCLRGTSSLFLTNFTLPKHFMGLEDPHQRFLLGLTSSSLYPTNVFCNSASLNSILS